MRYLFGDSTPFPLGYNFLATLEAFMAASTRIVQLDLEAQLFAKQREEIARSRLKGLEGLEQFHTIVMHAVHDAAQKVHHQPTLDYAGAIAEYATQHVEDHRRATLGANEHDAMQVRDDAEHRASEMRAQVEGFLKAARIPVLKTKVSVRVNIDGKEVRYTGTAAFEHPDGITTAFTIAPHRSPAWAAPRKVAEFAQGVDLKVGVEKSWLRGTVTSKQLSIDDWTIAQVDLSDQAFDLVLRRKPTEKELLVFRLRRNEAGLTVGAVEHPGAAGSETSPGTLDAQDVAHLERLWQELTPALREIAEEKQQLLDVSLDAQPVFDDRLVLPFVVRLVGMFAPMVREIAQRSPNEFELTLKAEADGGRREELYLRKDALLSALQPLPAQGRDVFAPLGLESWVPSKTNAPPPAVLLGSDRSSRVNGTDTPSMFPSAPPSAAAPPPPSTPPLSVVSSAPPSPKKLA